MLLPLESPPPSMPFSVQVTDPIKANELAKVMTDSRWVDPHWKILFEDGTTADQVISETAQRLPYNLTRRQGKRHQMAVDQVTGEVVGTARWILPEHLRDPKFKTWPEARVPSPSIEDDEKFRKKFEDATDEEGRIKHLRWDLMEVRNTPLEEIDAKIVHDTGPFLTLDYLSTAPHYQRKGVGSALLQRGLEVADANNLSTYVTASPAGLKLYLNHGFEIVETFSLEYPDFGGTEPVVDYFMIRKPKQKS
ncbi:acyl-CoA N-acyltransferase [Aureobasidium pullulans]|nr:acyl-CoA N-acyltransferase [Aureobasidium pullulans]